MTSGARDESPERDFHHPYQPYEIQKELMTAVYRCIEEGKVGIFESPTEDEPEWMRKHVMKEKKELVRQRRDELETRLELVRQKERKAQGRLDRGEPAAKRQKVSDADGAGTDEDEQFALDDYDIDDQAETRTTKQASSDANLSAETHALMTKLGLIRDTSKADSLADGEDELKVFFCSRTHSQLSQFVGELRRVKLPSSLPPPDDISAGEDLGEEVKSLSLGSRKNLCINKKVSSLGSVHAMNERCLQLQDAKTPVKDKCPYLPKGDNEGAAADFQHHTLAKIRDIEDMGSLGRKLGVCPYYASRGALKASEIVTLPYQLLLQTSARESLGIHTKNHVVIIDEAHNLMDTILGIYTVEISLAQLQRGREQLMVYLGKFRNRLKGKNRVYVTQVVRLLDSLVSWLQAKVITSGASDGTVDMTELLTGKGVDQIDLYKLMKYLQESRLARKVQGYILQEEGSKDQTQKMPVDAKKGAEASLPVLNHIQSFFIALTNPAAEGRFFYSSDTAASETKLKYLLLDPSEHFRDIVESARAIILAGGTMSPMDDYFQQLFPYLPPGRAMTLSCGHVIPPSSLFVRALTTDAAGANFDFTFSRRGLSETINSLGESILLLLPSIPDGVVVFFPSYGYLDQVLATWKRERNGSTPLWAQMEAIKPAFVDGQTSTNAEDTLTAYSNAINSHASRGAVLFSVIGGRLSEGINFSDRLGRCVVVVGLPYPNPNSPEWKAKMDYIEQKAVAHGQTKGIASRDFAENVCMRAVNQAVGRAIRHKDDWAAILLVDGRYAQQRIQEKLPKWIRASLPQSSRPALRSAGNDLSSFFEDRSKK